MRLFKERFLFKWKEVSINVFKIFKLPRASRGRKKLKEQGQILLIYAFFIPLLFFFVGITFDLSWYYLNVSRMQNAADAAVIAGAQTLIGENGNLYCYIDKNFVQGYDGKKVAEYYQDTTLGDTIAKSYVQKNLARKSAGWENDTIVDSWTKNELSFESMLFGSLDDDFETLYYHVMLEEDVPYMFLNGWFDTMNAKVSAVVKISQYMKGYDLFEQMKYLGFKRNRLAMVDENDKNYVAKQKAIKERTIYPNMEEDYVEKLNFNGDDRDKNFYDYLLAKLSTFADFETSADTTGGSSSSVKKSRLIHRIINVNEAYPVRDYGLYYNYNILRRIREENSAYEDLDDDELATALAKDSSDPLFILIERETDSPRQIIININVSNITDSYRPIVFIYDGPAYEDSYPVILNLNADFRGVLYAPNSPVVINGNENGFQGFVIAKSYVELETNNEDNFYDMIYDEYTDDYGDTQYRNVMLVDGDGDVQYVKDFDGSYRTIEPNINNEFPMSAFNLGSSDFDSFSLVKQENYVAPSYSSTMLNNLFIQQTK